MRRDAPMPFPWRRIELSYRRERRLEDRDDRLDRDGRRWFRLREEERGREVGGVGSVELKPPVCEWSFWKTMFMISCTTKSVIFHIPCSKISTASTPSLGTASGPTIVLCGKDGLCDPAFTGRHVLVSTCHRRQELVLNRPYTLTFLVTYRIHCMGDLVRIPTDRLVHGTGKFPVFQRPGPVRVPLAKHLVGHWL